MKFPHKMLTPLNMQIFRDTFTFEIESVSQNED